MTNLTEQWKQGKLPEGVYYCNTGNTIETLFTWGKNHHQLTNNNDEVYIPEMDDCEVIERVPTYEEQQAKLDENTKLKELLKRARGLMNCTKDWACTDATEAMIAKINQVLGEE